MKRDEIQLTEVLCSKIREWPLQMFEVVSSDEEAYYAEMEEEMSTRQELDSMGAYAYYFKNSAAIP